MSLSFDENPGIPELVLRGLVGVRSTETGRKGMRAEQTVCCGVLKQYREFSYGGRRFR